MDEDTLMRDPDMTIEARLKVDPDFATALYHEQRKRIAELEDMVKWHTDYANGKDFELTREMARVAELEAQIASLKAGRFIDGNDKPF
jgi:predicted phage gp36 major capsid-like protein